MKIAIVGAGTAGLLTALDLCYGLPDEAEIELIHDPDIAPLGVGEATLYNFPASLGTIEYSHAENRHDLDATAKFGVRFKNWKGDGFVPFFAGSHGIHFNTNELAAFVIPRLKKLYPNFTELHGTVHGINGDGKEVIIGNRWYNYAIDCRGFNKIKRGNDLPIHVNRAIVFDSMEPSPWDYSYHIAHKNGWMFGIPLSNRVSFGYLFNELITTEQEAFADIQRIVDEGIDGYKPRYSSRPGNFRHYNFESYHAPSICNRNGNVFVNGNRALFFEPLQSTSIGAYGFINNIIMDAMCQGIDPNPRFRKLVEECIMFINLHYRNGSDYDTPFWKYASMRSQDLLFKYDLHNYNWEYMIDTFQMKERMYSNFLYNCWSNEKGN